MVLILGSSKSMLNQIHIMGHDSIHTRRTEQRSNKSWTRNIGNNLVLRLTLNSITHYTILEKVLLSLSFLVGKMELLSQK